MSVLRGEGTEVPGWPGEKRTIYRASCDQFVNQGLYPQVRDSEEVR
jgi:hypothetical protein